MTEKNPLTGWKGFGLARRHHKERGNNLKLDVNRR
jgi:hypothetical protein